MLNAHNNNRLQVLTPDKLEAIIAGAETLEKDRRGDKVLRLKNGAIFKIFTCKSRLSKSFWRPYSISFVKNALILGVCAIPTVTLKQLYQLPDRRKTAVEYQPLPGQTLDECIDGSLDKDRLSEGLGTFIQKLHQQGIYFRAVHPGNIILDDNNRWGLIDIADLKFYEKPLSEAKRRRNFHHLLRRHRFRQCLQQLNPEKIMAGYCQNISAPDSIKASFEKIWLQYLN